MILGNNPIVGYGSPMFMTDTCDKILFSKNFITNFYKICFFIITDGYKYSAIVVE